MFPGAAGRVLWLQFLPVLTKADHFTRCVDHSHPSGSEVVSQGGLIYIFPLAYDVEHLFKCLLAISVSSLGKYVFMSLARF